MKICKVEKKREIIDTDYEVCGNEYCCEKMKQWLRIGARSRHHLRYDIDTGRFEIEVRELSSGYDYHPGPECDAAYEDLNFCPFCGMRLQATQPKVIESKIPIVKKRLQKLRWKK